MRSIHIWTALGLAAIAAADPAPALATDKPFRLGWHTTTRTLGDWLGLRDETDSESDVEGNPRQQQQQQQQQQQGRISGPQATIRLVSEGGNDPDPFPVAIPSTPVVPQSLERIRTLEILNSSGGGEVFCNVIDQSGMVFERFTAEDSYSVPLDQQPPRVGSISCAFSERENESVLLRWEAQGVSQERRIEVVVPGVVLINSEPLRRVTDVEMVESPIADTSCVLVDPYREIVGVVTEDQDYTDLDGIPNAQWISCLPGVRRLVAS